MSVIKRDVRDVLVELYLTRLLKQEIAFSISTKGITVVLSMGTAEISPSCGSDALLIGVVIDD